MGDTIVIVQVHLGKVVPSHLYAQMKQTRVFNPRVPIFLIISAEAQYDRKAIDDLDVFVVMKESIASCRNHRLFLRRNKLNKKALGGFWLYTSERFFVIESFLEACRLTNIVHLENDVMLYAGLDRLLPVFLARCPRLGMTMDSDTRCVPGFMFIRDRESLYAMNDFIVRKALRKAKNDMRAAAFFMNEMGPEACTALPVIPSRYRELYPLVNREGEMGAKAWYDQSYEAFSGIFDAAALGQFLGGIDKKISSGDTKGFISETAVYDPRKMGIHWKSEAGLKRPYGEVDGLEFPIFNLHIHSKELTEFSSRTPS